MQVVVMYVIVFTALAVAVFYFVRRLVALGRSKREDGCQGCPLKGECGKGINKKTSASGSGCGCSDGCTKGSE